jgi:surface antigen
MSVTTFGTAELMGVQTRLPQPRNFWLQFFGRTFTSTAEKIMFDELGEEDRRLAPFVAPMAQGKVMRELGFVTRSFRPAYVKPKHIVHPQKLLSRMAGEQIGGELSPEQRRQAVIADLLRMQRDMIERRWDWMAAQALMFGQVVVEGEDYPTQVVNFGRDASLTTVLTGEARWTVGNAADPLNDIRIARTNAYNLGSYPVNTLVMGLGAWQGFSRNTAVQDLLKRDVRNGSTDFRAANLNAGEPWAYEGTIRGGGDGQGGFDVWTYQGTFRDDAGNAVGLMNTNDVVGIGQPDGVRAFGAILDMDNLAATPMFPKNWRNMDPSVEYLMTQSAPLMVPLRPNSTFRIRVG